MESIKKKIELNDFFNFQNLISILYEITHLYDKDDISFFEKMMKYLWAEKW